MKVFNKSKIMKTVTGVNGINYFVPPKATVNIPCDIKDNPSEVVILFSVKKSNEK